MILKKLCEYHDMVEEEDDRNGGERRMPGIGYFLQKVSCVATIDRVGRLVSISSLTEDKESKEFKLPGEDGRTSNIAAYVAWETPKYAICYDANEDDKISKVSEGKNKKKVQNPRFKAFVDRNLSCQEEINDESFDIFCKFLKNWDPADNKYLDVDKKTMGGSMVFAISGDECYLHEKKSVRACWDKFFIEEFESGQEGVCLITGEIGFISKKHGSVKPFGEPCSFVNYNIESSKLNSFKDKESSYTAPCAKTNVRKYRNALNYLCNYSNASKINIGETAHIVWSNASTKYNKEFTPSIMPCLSASKKELSNAELKKSLVATIANARRGLYNDSHVRADDEGKEYYILGIAQNSGRCYVKFFYDSDISVISEKFLKHSNSFCLEDHLKPISISRIGYEIDDKKESGEALKTKHAEKIQEQILQCILSGKPYPDIVAIKIINQIVKNKKSDKPRVTISQRAILTSYINKQTENKIQMSLDQTNEDPGYLLGRLLSVYNKIQNEAMPEVNKTVVETYFSSAFTKPAFVHVKVSQSSIHHEKKLDTPKRIWLSRIRAEIFDKLNAVPERLTLNQKSQLAIGYEHQTSAFFKKKESESE